MQKLSFVKQEIIHYLFQEQLNVLQGASMTIPWTPMPSYPGTSQVRTSLMGQMPPQPYQSPGAQGPAIPSHLPQFGSYGIGSPACPGSAFGQADIENDFNNVDGEYYHPEDQGQYFVPDSSLVQDWPFGHKVGVEGKSTITYEPQGSMSRGFGQADPGMMANALRGQSIQYGNMPAQQGQAVRPAMSGPGFFAQSTQQPSQPTVSQAPSQPFGGMMGLGSQGQSPAMSPKPPALSTGAVSKTPTTSIMPPNAVASPSVTTKSRLIPESVGVPSPKPGEKPTLQSTTLFQQQAGQGIFGGKATSQAQVPTSEGPATSSSLLASLLTDPKLAGQQSSGGFAPGSAASVLNILAMKHKQEASKTQTTSAAPTVATTAQSTPQKTVFSGFSFTSTPKITEPKVEEEPTPVVTTSAPAEKPFSGFSFTLPPKSTATTPSTKTETPKADVKEEKPSAFGKFGAASGESGFKFGNSGGTAQTGSSQSGSGFKFGAPASTGEKSETQSGGFKFSSQSTVGTEAAGGKPATGFKFGTTSTTDTAKPATGGFKFGVQPSDATESKESVKDNTETKTLDLSKQATSAGFMVDKDSSKYTFETPSKSTDAKKESDESKTCDTKPNLLAHLLDTQNSMWKCDKCLVNNDNKEQKCVCCGEVRPGAKPDMAPAAASSALSKFSAKPGGGFNIGGFGATPSTNSGFTFGSSQVSDKPKEEESAKPKGFSFGDASKSGGGFAFGTPTKVEPFKFEPDKNKMTSTSSEGFNFSLSMTPTMPHSGRSPLKSPGVKSPKSPEEDEENVEKGE